MSGLRVNVDVWGTKMNDCGMPSGAAFSAHVLLDAVISQSETSTDSENTRAMTTALESLLAENHGPSEGEIVGASVVCISWLVARLAQDTAREPEDVVSEMRDFLDGFQGAETAHRIDTVEE
jgi:hypothetical protein